MPNQKAHVMHCLSTEINKKYRDAIIGVRLSSHGKVYPFAVKNKTEDDYITNLSVYDSLDVCGKIALFKGDDIFISPYNINLSHSSIVLERVAAGYINLPFKNVSSVFLSKTFNKQWKRGFTEAAYYYYGLPQGMSLNDMCYSHFTVTTDKQPDMTYYVLYYYSHINFPYPSYEKALSLVTNGVTNRVAFAKEFAVKNTQVGLGIEFCGGLLTGKINKDNGKITLFKKYMNINKLLLDTEADHYVTK